MISAASLSRSSCTLVERPSAFYYFGLCSGIRSAWRTTADPAAAVEGCGSCSSSKPWAPVKKTSEVDLRHSRSGGPNLRSASRVRCIGSFQEKVVGVAAKRLQPYHRVVVVDTCRLGPLEKGFPSKRQHATRVGSKNRERWGWFTEELLSQCYSVWTPLQSMFYGLRLLSATRAFRVDCHVKLSAAGCSECGCCWL